MTAVLEHKRIRAPSRHGGLFADPPLNRAGDYLNSNLRSNRDADLLGRRLTDLAAEAQRELIGRASEYTRSYRPIADAPPDAPIIMSGHQPELFHAGVWFKNFALSSLAARLGTHAINLLIDNDACGAPSIRVPSGTRAEPRIQTIRFDDGPLDTPFESRAIENRDLFATFASRVRESVGEISPDPLIRQLWPLAIERAGEDRNLGRCLAAARHGLEGQWGQQTVELPLSAICETQPFRWFAATLLTQAERFRQIHNRAVADYRRVHRIRSRSHPVPELVVDGDWVETPFWVWTDTNPVRKRLFVCQHDKRWSCGDRRDLNFEVSAESGQSGQAFADRLSELSSQRIRIRPRALTTTMFARLLLCDMFLHGIGGAKYDQLTDVIISRFLGIAPPKFMTLSATALLVENRADAIDEQLRYTKTILRELRYHPERHLDGDANIERLVQEKQHWLDIEPPQGHRRERHLAIESVNLALQPFLENTRRRLQRKSMTLATELRNETRLASREFSFCLFSEERLRPLLLELSSQ